MDEEGIFAVRIDYQSGSREPSHVFKAMANVLDSLAQLDQDLAVSLGVRVKPVLLLERVEAGSVKTWLRTALESVDDEDIHDLNMKRGVGGFLVRAKHYILRKLSEKSEISGRDEVRDLSKGVQELAAQAEIGWLPSPSPVPVDRLLGNLSALSSALSSLSPEESATFESDEGSVSFNAGLKLSSEDVERLLTRESITNASEMILKVKRPDYLGSAQWELRHHKHPIEAKLEDAVWLERFQTRQVSVLPGDALRARVRSEVKYGHDGDVVATHYTITEVLEVLRYDKQEQIQLLPPPNDDSMA